VQKPVNWLTEHPLFRGLATPGKVDPSLMVAYVEGFAPVVNSVPAFLHVTLSRADGKAKALLREIWNDELGLSGTKSHPVLFEELHAAVTSAHGRNEASQRVGIVAAGRMVELCGSGPWPIGVAAMKAHEGQFPSAYGSILPAMERSFGPLAEFFRLHSEADVEHTAAGAELLRMAIEEHVVTEAEADRSYVSSTDLLRTLMDGIFDEIGDRFVDTQRQA
jgi:pyrroloquinoline quinone (PQQ) biosynthesis protein C